MVPDNLCNLNYPIETEEAKLFWGSRHKCNRMKAIIAFSLDLDNANDNLRRYGYKLFWRKRAIKAFGVYVNKPDMGTIPFTPLSVTWWECMNQVPPPPSEVLRWMDRMEWNDAPAEWAGES